MNVSLTLLAVLVSCALARFAGGQPEDRDPTAAAAERERLLLEKWGPGAPFEAGLTAGACFLLSERAGLPVPGSPPRQAPAYDEAFGAGSTVGLRFSYRFRPVISAFVSAALEHYPGMTRYEGQLGTVSYGDMVVIPCLAGLRVGAPLGLDPSAWLISAFAPRVDGLFPFAEAGVGIAWRAGVDLDPVGSYWEPAAVFSARASAGLEFRYEGLSLAAAGAFSYHSEPPESPWYAEAEAAMALSVTASVSFRF